MFVEKYYFFANKRNSKTFSAKCSDLVNMNGSINFLTSEERVSISVQYNRNKSTRERSGVIDKNPTRLTLHGKNFNYLIHSYCNK